MLADEGDRLKEDARHIKLKVSGADWYVVMQGGEVREGANIEDDLEDLLGEIEFEIMADDVMSKEVPFNNKTDYGLIWGEDGYVLSGEWQFTINDLQKMLWGGSTTMMVAGGPRSGQVHEVDLLEEQDFPLQRGAARALICPRGAKGPKIELRVQPRSATCELLASTIVLST